MALFSSARPPKTILVVATRRIGDVLLTTPLVRSLKARWPDAQIDMLVFRGTEGVLEHNPDVRRVIVVAQRAGASRIGTRRGSRRPVRGPAGEIPAMASARRTARDLACWRDR